MAEVDTNQVSLRLGVKALSDAFTFRGRSTATEVVSFYLLYMAILVGVILLHFALPFEWEDSLAMQVFRGLFEFIFTFPFLALLVRRLHDQERTLRWLWLVPVSYGATIVMMLLPEAEHYGFSVRFFGLTRHPAWSLLTASLLLVGVSSFFTQLALLLMPGTEGPNRHGPDPRLDPASQEGFAG